MFTWRGVEWDQHERWFVARVAHFDPTRAAMTEAEQADLTASRWWTLADLEDSDDDLVPGDLAALLRDLLADGPPSAPIEVGV